MPNVLYRLSKKQVGDKAEVLVRFYASKFEQFARTRVYVPIKYWNEKERRLSYSTRYYTPEVADVAEKQKLLDRLRSAILEAYIHAPVPGSTWLQDVVDMTIYPETFGSGKVERLSVAEASRRYPGEHSIKEGTAEHYAGLARLLDRFGEVSGHLYVGEVSPDDIADFVSFLSCEVVTLKSGKQKVVKRGHNTIVMKLKKLRSVLRWCRASGLASNCPFDTYAIPDEFYGRPIFLKLEERDRLIRLQDLPPVLELVRDVFIFQCFVGCRVGDLYELTADNISQGGSFLVYKQNKVQDAPVVSVPLLPIARNLVAKYSGKDPDGRLFPFVAEQTYNEYIKRVLEIANITRDVVVYDPVTLEPLIVPLCTTGSSHLARRTFMGNIFKLTKSERITTSFTGHKDGSKAVKRYTDVDDEMKVEVMQLVDPK